jgi:excisionase family DNA binding protein
MPIEPASRELVPTSDVPNYLGHISRVKVYQLIKQGELKKVKIGKRSFVLKSSIDAFIDRLIEDLS